jgi:filamentous hemagglutinin
MKLARVVRLGIAASIASNMLPLAHAELPVPCGACSNAGRAVAFYDQNLARPPVGTPTVSGNTMTIVQHADKAALNWQTFNISRDAAVVFQQPSSNSIALNRVWDPTGNPSRILGALTANGQVYLINRNGILFGEGAQVNVGSLVASSLDASDRLLEDGVFAPLRNGQPAFALSRQIDANGNAVAGGSVRVEPGAVLASAKNGRIMLLAPKVENRGTLRSPDGQIILAAGERAWIADSSDPNLRGFLVEVDAGGNARNLGDIMVDRGNASLVGLAVNQEGRISAKTSVSLGGSIRLVARDTMRLQQTTLIPERSGAVVFGEGSVTEVVPDFADAATAIDEQAQPVSTITASGKSIAVSKSARITATSGLIDMVAAVDPAQPLTGETAGNGARIDIASGSVLDVSGTKDVVLPMERNVLTVELRGNELRDSPLQRTGILYGKKVNVDAREGTPIADISGALAGIRRGIGERTTAGGSIRLRSEDALSVGAGATLDVSGGSVRYKDGLIATTKLVSNGRIYDIGEADPNRTYDAILGSYEKTSSKWGMTSTFVQFSGTAEPGYVEGKDAGSITLLGSRVEMAGTLRGETTTGARQRRLPSSSALPWARPANELPLGGQVIFGDASQLSAIGTANFRMPSVMFRTPGNASDAIPPGTLVLDPALFRAGGFSRVEIYSDGRIVLPQDEQIKLGPGGELTLVAGSVTENREDGSIAPSLQIDGEINAPSGHLTLRTLQNAAVGDPVQQDLRHVLAVGGKAVLDVSGRWVNDSPAVSASLPSDALAIDGGSIRLASAGGIDIADGAGLMLNGGAWFDRRGRINPGSGGDLTIGSSLSTTVPGLHLGGMASSYSLATGGSLNISASGIDIAETGHPGINGGVWTIDPSFFQQGGFSAYNLTATHLGLNIAEGTVIEPRAMNWVLDGEMKTAPSGTPFQSLAHLERLPDYLRKPVDLNLTSRRGLGGADINAGLTLSTGAAINADLGATVGLSSDRMLVVEGAVRAPAGKITLSLTPNSDVDLGLVPDKAIWLGSDALLAAPAAVRSLPDPLGLRQGEVLAGGTVALRAQRGFVVTAPGSLIDAGGTSATFDIARSSASGISYVPTTVAGSGGTIQIAAPEGMIIAGGMRAQAADVAGAAGGTLSIAFGSGTADPQPDIQQGDFTLPAGAREMTLSTADPTALMGGLQPGDSLFSTADLTALRSANNHVEARAAVSLQQLQQAGFDAVNLKVRPLVRNSVAVDDALIRFDAGTELKARGRISLDAPVLAGGGGDVLLEAPYVALGPTDTVLRFNDEASSGGGTLIARADLIDLTGDIAVQGFGSRDRAALVLESSGDVRLTGLRVPVTSADTTGSLKTVDDLHIAAAQIYPTTLTEFTLEATGAGSTVSLGSSTSRDYPVPLSAGGVLNVKAANIEVSGTLRAPHGHISLEAANLLTLAPGSEVSVAGPATPVPYGQTQFGVDWVLPYDQALVRVLGGPSTESWSVALPKKEVELVAEDIDLAPGAKVVLDGGGDLYAWEFIPGPGGSTDVLLAANAKGAVAILPTAQLSSAPLDPFIQYNGLSVGDMIEIGRGVAGLPAGEYALLPARYALLPGAFLLTPQPGAANLAPADYFTSSNGLPIVAARRGSALAETHDSLWSGYLVENGMQVRQRAEYRESLASDFFAGAASSQQLPVDAGRLTIDAGAALSLGATVSAEGRGRGGQVDIVADHLAVVDAPTGQSDRVELTAQGLSQLRVESLLLGGRREQTAEGTRISASAQDVSVESGVDLGLPEILLVASADGGGDGNVRVAKGASLRGVGQEAATPARYLMEGDTALLRVSSGDAAQIERSSVPPQGQAQLALERGSSLTAGVESGAKLTGGSITLDSSGDARSAGDLTLGTNGALQLAASHISLGDLPAGGISQGLALSRRDLAALKVSNLFLKSASSIDIYGRLDIAVDGTLAIDAPSLRGMASDGALEASLHAGTLTWQGAAPASVSDPVADTAGQLTLAATAFHLGKEGNAAPSDLSIQGFAVTHLEADREWIARGGGALQVAGDLQLAAPWLTTSNGADWRIQASALSITGKGGDVAVPADAGLGSRLALTGSEVTVDGNMLLPSGTVELHATGAGTDGMGVRLGAGALIDVASLKETFLDKTLATPGGNVALSADAGGIRMESGSRIDVSGSRGAITINARGAAILNGELVADGDGGNEGAFSLTAQGINDFSALNETLNAGGFGAARNFHLRSGDVTIGADETLRARGVAIVLDGEPAEGDSTPTGNFTLNGTIDASGEAAGQVRIDARGNVDLAEGAIIDAHASGEDRAGGQVELGTAAGKLTVATGAIIDVSGTRKVSYERPLFDGNGQIIQRTDDAGNPLFDALGQPLPVLESTTVTDTGQVRYRVPGTTLLGADSANRPVLKGAVVGAGRIELEAFRAYTDSILDAADVAPVQANPYYQDAVDLMSHEADIRSALGVSGTNFHLVPGIEIQSPGDLTLAAEWNLAQWRFGTGGEPGVLDLRAGGDIRLQQSLSDGVERVLDPVLFVEKDALREDASWSLRLTAGADLKSVDPLAVNAGHGDVVVGADAVLRTGTGDIEVRAARDVVLSNASSVIYTTGIDAGIGTLDPAVVSLYVNGVYPILGGDVDIAAGRHVEAAASNQLVNDWLWRIGGSNPGLGELPRTWNVSLTDFKQGVAAFGGGNVHVTAGGDVRNLSAAVPTTGRQIGSNRFDSGSGTFSVESDEVVVGGGDSLVVRAGGDIVGGVYVLGRGLGELTAGGSIARQNAAGLYAMLGLGDGQWQVTAGRDAAVETVFNPTLVKQALYQDQAGLSSSFVTYGNDSALTLTALAGEAWLNQDTNSIRNHFFSARQLDALELNQFRLFPGSLQATSFRGDVIINHNLDLIAEPAGQLSFFADGNVSAVRNASPNVTMLDAVNAPPIHGDDPEPVRIVARHGDIGGDTLNFSFPKPARLDASGDIRNVRLDVQHLHEKDVTVLTAGGSIVHDTTRAGSGVLGVSTLTYRVSGPGRIDFMAGGDIDLGTADGILTLGNTINPFLPEGGAGVTLVAGLREPPRFDDFIRRYLVESKDYAAALAGYLKGYETDPSRGDVENFLALPPEQQRPFLWKVLFAELRASGVAATTSGSNDYSRGYAAIETLFPKEVYGDEGSRNLSLLLSRITTLAGGDINILVPGGSANAGVATASALIKQPSELGIVVQGRGDINAFVRDDFAVNQSRVFTLDGGDLLMWSSYGDIDAGRGAKSAIAAPPPQVTIDENGKTIITFPPAIAGSGIRAVVTTEGVKPGDVYLFAPAGVVSAGDAGIGSAGNVTIGAVEVRGADNIDVGGTAIGVPLADTGSLAAGLSGVSSASTAAAKSTEEAVAGGTAAEGVSKTPLADAAFAVLDVVVLEFGEDTSGNDHDENVQ